MAKTLNQNFYNSLLTKPQIAIEELDLIYVNVNDMHIVRKKRDSGFCYLLHDKTVTEKRELDRINSLVIPPAWKKVKITELPNGHLQAVGRDKKNRRQYRYHEDWMKIRNQTKFYKLVSFAESLPKIRAQVDKDLKREGWPKNKVVALIVKLMEETHIRIGNEQYAKRNKTYGLSTMRKRHINLYKERLRFEFVGKKGKKHKVTLRNKKLVRLVNQCEEIPGWELFKYYDATGEKHSVDSGLVNDYIHKISGYSFSSKDFRTWAASLIFFDALYDMSRSKSKKIIKNNILTALDMAAKGLGNSRNVCRNYYVHPYIVTAYENGTIEKFFKKVNIDSSNAKWYSNSEIALLSLLKSYKPSFS
ncbi:DNA topoisomerase IB [uncultured Winogradskyella sp.]|uniref:DNA topoisomerase IB n=1 Tax=uncultured Winogradskyella sp. TaxID=395353 RepID=UPI00262A66B6|nr:DNA topoisomerase IB [uncultured Winogradskyella sp.]